MRIETPPLPRGPRRTASERLREALQALAGCSAAQGFRVFCKTFWSTAAPIYGPLTISSRAGVTLPLNR